MLVLTLKMAMTDFWWLTHEQANKYVYVELVHHQPLTDEADASHQSFNNPCFAEIQSMSKWCNKYQNTNVYRSLKICANNSKGEALSGPFVLDIDNSKNLDDTLIVTQKAVKCIFNSYNLKESDLRLFFTGHKGFNIEVLPSALGLAAGTQSEQDNKADCIREKIISELRRNAGLASQPGQCRNLVSEQGTLIDPIHKHVRLHDSINKWIENGGQKARRKIALTLKELCSLQITQIVGRSIV